MITYLQKIFPTVSLLKHILKCFFIKKDRISHSSSQTFRQHVKKFKLMCTLDETGATERDKIEHDHKIILIGILIRKKQMYNNHRI